MTHTLGKQWLMEVVKAREIQFSPVEIQLKPQKTINMHVYLRHTDDVLSVVRMRKCCKLKRNTIALTPPGWHVTRGT